MCSWFELESYEMNIVNAFRVGGTMLYWYLLYLNTFLHCTPTAGRCGSGRRHWCRTRGNAALRGRLSWARWRVGDGRTLGDRRVGGGRFMYLDDVGSGCRRRRARSGLRLLGLVWHRDAFRRSWWRGAWRSWMPPTVSVTLVVDSREYEHVEHQKKTAYSNCDTQGCRVAVVVPRGQSLKKSCFVFVVVFVRPTHEIFFRCRIRETFSSVWGAARVPSPWGCYWVQQWRQASICLWPDHSCDTKFIRCVILHSGLKGNCRSLKIKRGGKHLKVKGKSWRTVYMTWNAVL